MGSARLSESDRGRTGSTVCSSVAAEAPAELGDDAEGPRRVEEGGGRGAAMAMAERLALSRSLAAMIRQKMAVPPYQSLPVDSAVGAGRLALSNDHSVASRLSECGDAAQLDRSRSVSRSVTDGQ